MTVEALPLSRQHSDRLNISVQLVTQLHTKRRWRGEIISETFIDETYKVDDLINI